MQSSISASVTSRQAYCISSSDSIWTTSFLSGISSLNAGLRARNTTFLNLESINLHPNSVFATVVNSSIIGSPRVRSQSSPSQTYHRNVHPQNSRLHYLFQALAEEYIDKAKNNTLTLEDIYGMWIEWKSTSENKKNVERIEAEWKAYYLNEPKSTALISKPFAKITTLELREWAEDLMRKYIPDKKKFYRMFLIINNCYEYAADEAREIVPVNLWKQAKEKLNPALIRKKSAAKGITQVFSEDEHNLLKKFVYEDLERYKKQSSSAGLQILFLLQTGLRIGECCGLKWSDISKDYIYISRQANNDGVIDHNKSEKSTRSIPLTDEAKKSLQMLKLSMRSMGILRNGFSRVTILSMITGSAITLLTESSRDSVKEWIR